jgi:hypothetical protein
MAILLVLAATVSPASAWGRAGHRVVARVAAKNLSAGARQKIAVILGTTASKVELAMAEASTWPDEIDKKATASENWHWVDISVSGPFTIGNACASHQCVIDRIEEMRDRLQMNSTGFMLAAPPNPPRPMTSQELAFLIHFVGDIHQPLHAAVNGDRGGNCVLLQQPLHHSDGTETTELHAVWDVDEVLAVLNKLGAESTTANTLFKRFKNGESVAQMTVTDWAHESNDLARTDVYQKLMIAPHTAPPGQCATDIAKVQIGQTYLDGNAADVTRRLLQAGIRLSNLLNQMCAGAGCQAMP